MEGWIVGGGLAVFFILRLVVVRSAKPRPREEPPLPRPKEHRTLATVQEGEFVKLTGTIQSGHEALAAPLSGRPCVAYLACAKVWHSKKIPQLIADAREMKLAPVVLAVAGGEIIIEGECVVEHPTASPSPRTPAREASFLASRQLERYLASTEFQEAIVRAGDAIWVSGVLLRDRSGEVGYRDGPVRTRLVAKPNRPLTIGKPRR